MFCLLGPSTYILGAMGQRYFGNMSMSTPATARQRGHAISAVSDLIYRTTFYY